MLAFLGRLLKGSCPLEMPEIVSELPVVMVIPFRVAISSSRGVVLSARWMVQPESAARGVEVGSLSLSSSVREEKRFDVGKLLLKAIFREEG